MYCKRNLLTLTFILAVLTPFLIKTNSKNTCVSYFDYFLINFGGNCYYNPDVDLGVPEIIKKYTGDVRVYNVTTEDGYLLTMFRISKKDPIGVVLLQPPMSAGSIAWLSDGPHSLGISLWKKGYDVWLSNHRGLSYSRQHINLSESDPEFWNYGFHEIALYDLQPQFEIISKETNSKIIYIGYSVASTEALIYASMKPEDAEKFVSSFILMAPLTVLENFSSPFKYIFYGNLFLKDFFQSGEFVTLETVRWSLTPVTIVPLITTFLTSIIMGWTPSEMDPVLYPYIFPHHGRGISNQMIYHYGQNFFNQTHFLMYDYGKDTNRLKYASDRPPSYPLQNIRNPIYIIHGDKDKISTPADINTLCEQFLPRETVKNVVLMHNHNHIDFMFSRHRRRKTYKTVYTILNKIKSGV